MLTQTTDYALRALVYLAHDPEDGYHQTRDLATALNIPGNYLGKILQLLAHHKLVESQRGMHGGFRLARLPEQVRLYDVLKALDTLPTDPECPLMTGGRQMELCGLHRRFAAMTRQYLDFLRGTTLHDLLVDHSMPATCPGRIPATDPLPCPDHAGHRLVVLT
ncbi:MAG TPA: Rrf2 family transcriptional regulator [Tepidisphaeraceae bacterium]|nr:Rrf2 family transcriptional regulator [Tepidisphaeraceae bacterium]